jgi:ABC-type branched-subunit amino acid transport system ATPase component
MLKLVDIHTYYGDSYVLQGVSLEVSAETVVALLGRNGVGKTTLIRSIIGFTPARRGYHPLAFPSHRKVKSGSCAPRASCFSFFVR